MHGPCMCGDPYCSSCGDPEAMRRMDGEISRAEAAFSERDLAIFTGTVKCSCDAVLSEVEPTPLIVVFQGCARCWEIMEDPEMEPDLVSGDFERMEGCEVW